MNIQLNYLHCPKFHYFRHLLKSRTNKTNLMKISQLLTLAMVVVLSITTNAQKAAKKANAAFDNLAYTEAAKLYKVAEAQEKNLDQKAFIFFRIGECERLSAHYSQAMEWYDKAITAQYNNVNPEVHYDYGLCLENLERWDDATAQYNKYIAKGGDKTKANARMAACKDVAEKKAGKQKFIITNVAEMNSPFFDFAAQYSAKKGEQMMFSTGRQAATGGGVDPITGESCQDLFFVDVDKKKKMSTPQPVAGNVNTARHEGAMCFNKDFSEMYYTAINCDPSLPGPGDIYMSKKVSNGWEEGVIVNLIDREADDTTTVGHPCLTLDNKYMIFVSDMPGGKGGKDLWYASWDKKADTWVKPTNLGAINTKGDEYFPYVAEDGSLYFSSNGLNGLGGLDVFRAEKTGDISFGTPAGLPYPINTTSDDFALILEDKKEGDKSFSGYLTSNRPGGKGLDDIYHFAEPPLEFTLAGTAYDKETGAPLSNANVVVNGSDGASYKLTTDGNGGFSLDKTQLMPEVSYTVDIAKDQYIGTGDNFSTKGLKASVNFARDYFLIPIPKPTDEINMPLVQYPYNEATLLINEEVNSADSLNFLLEILQRNPKMVIQLEAHTDARGQDDYNLKLSQRRAQTCVDYLISKGIDAERLKAVGMGEKQPKTMTAESNGFTKGTTLTEAYIGKLTADKQEAAHALNRRTIFKILNNNYVPKK